MGAVTDDNEAVVSRQRFDCWGKVRSGGTIGTQTKVNYTGQQLDATGLLNYNARLYDPTVGRFVSPDSIVPGASSGVGGAGETVGEMQNSKLTVDFHESGFVAVAEGENSQTLQKGFWFQLSEQAKSKIDVFGPANPQALNRYSHALDNPLRYVDPSGHYTCLILCFGGHVSNNTTHDIFVTGNLLNPVTGEKYEGTVVLHPGESSDDYYMYDADFISGPGLERPGKLPDGSWVTVNEGYKFSGISLFLRGVAYVTDTELQHMNDYPPNYNAPHRPGTSPGDGSSYPPCGSGQVVLPCGSPPDPPPSDWPRCPGGYTAPHCGGSPPE